jgi:hypothetical protein
MVRCLECYNMHQIDKTKEHYFCLKARTRARAVDGKNLLFTELTEKGDKVVKAIDKLYAAIEIEYPEDNKRRSYMIKESGIFKPRI